MTNTKFENDMINMIVEVFSWKPKTGQIEASICLRGETLLFLWLNYKFHLYDVLLAVL